MIAWFMYKNEDYWFPRLYFSTVGYWGSIVAYLFPPFFAVL